MKAFALEIFPAECTLSKQNSAYDEGVNLNSTCETLPFVGQLLSILEKI